MITGYELVQAIYVAAKLGIADLLADGPRACGDLAKATETDEGGLYRTLRALAGAGVFADLGSRRFGLTPHARHLQAAVPGSLRAVALLAGERSYRAWGGLLHSVKTGQTAFEHVFGMGTFEYMAQNPDLAEIYNDAMTAASVERAAAVVRAYDFSAFRTIVDVGGGHGTLLAAILQAHPALQGILLERPSVAPGAQQHLERAGLAARCRVLACDFFRSIPGASDACLLSHIIHNWDDSRSEAILKNCRAAMPSTGRLLLVEKVMPEQVEASGAMQRTLMADLHMMVITGGRERTETEYQALFASAGFRLSRVIRTQAGESIIEGLPALTATGGAGRRRASPGGRRLDIRVSTRSLRRHAQR
jgi:hypothetical protein